MPDLVSRLRADLTSAMRSRDRTTVRVLRNTLAAVANAEAQPASDDVPVSLRSGGPIAGAASGLGAAETARRELTEADVLALVRAEHDELLAAGRADDAAVLARYLG